MRRKGKAAPEPPEQEKHDQNGQDDQEDSLSRSTGTGNPPRSLWGALHDEGTILPAEANVAADQGDCIATKSEKFALKGYCFSRAPELPQGSDTPRMAGQPFAGRIVTVPSFIFMGAVLESNQLRLDSSAFPLFRYLIF